MFIFLPTKGSTNNKHYNVCFETASAKTAKNLRNEKSANLTHKKMRANPWPTPIKL
eukprot:TRINITY_DN7206_c0_g1_i1.p2 TRINITY_DN7206_c0_g1~~TRINITY_DN7206_c0_g1_i1.p2  ORF type:complete len:56 (+),score=10.14 TRINITY_DN7206_c0_g1_i1:157-324(+)